jgi:hypothetical protein
MPLYPANDVHVEDEFDDARVQFEELVGRLRSPQAKAMTHAELEVLITQEGRELQRRLLQGHLDLRAAAERVRDSVKGADGVRRTHRRRRARALVSVVGLVTVARMAYGARGTTSVFPQDAALNLPEESYSHGLRYHAALEAVRGSFDSAVEAVARATGTDVPKRQIEELVRRAAQDFDAFYAARDEGTVVEAGNALLVLSLDNKGIVMRREDLREETRKAAEEAEHKLGRRLSKGEKRYRKRMATVAAVYDVAPFVRTPEDIFAELRSTPEAKRKARPKVHNKRVWASVEKGAEAVTREVFDETQRRDPEHRRRWVVLVDGDRHQIERILDEAKRRGVAVTLVVDIIHVLEYLWGAAWCFFDEGDRGAEAWVVEHAYQVLLGHSSDVAAGIRRSATLRELPTEKRKGADDCADYLIAKREFLRYDSYLARGLPIATGVIEGACRHLIGDRLDITGARWTVPGAEAVLRLRSLRSSGDLDEYWRFHLTRERERNYPTVANAA